MTGKPCVVLHGWNDWPPAYRWIRAYAAGDVIHLRRPFHHRLLGGLGAVWHELEHVKDKTFGNNEHHPLHHFCVRAKGLWRLPVHAVVSRSDAEEVYATIDR